jgi:hypothetical protein
MAFTKATPKKGKARIALVGGPGDGKTWTALLFATALAGPEGRIAAIDTEHGSMSKYASVEPGDGYFTFDVDEPDDFNLKDLLDKIRIAREGRYNVLLLDSFTHYWSGKGGALDVVGGNFNKWKDVTPIERRLIDALVAFPGHILVCMRAKGDYVDVPGANGKTKKEKAGVKPDQRADIEFEFDVVAYMNRDGDNVVMSVEKTRCPALHGEVFINPTGKHLDPLLAWLDRGTPDDTEYWTTRIDGATELDDLTVIYNDMSAKGVQARWLTLLTSKKEHLMAQQQALLNAARAKSRPGGDWGDLGAASPEEVWQQQANDLLGKPAEFKQLMAWARECGTYAFIESHVKLYEEEENAPI